MKTTEKNITEWGILCLASVFSLGIGFTIATWTQKCPAEKVVECEKEVECTLERARITDASKAAYCEGEMSTQLTKSCTPLTRYIVPSCEGEEGRAWDKGWSEGYSDGMADGWKTAESISAEKTPIVTNKAAKDFRNSRQND